MRNGYFVLILALIALYYLIFKFKYNQKYDEKNYKGMRAVGFTLSIGSAIASIGRIIVDLFPQQESLIENVFVVPVFASIFLLFYFLFPVAWRLRKDPKSKVMVYTGFGFIGFSIAVIVIALILSMIGIYD